MEKKAEGRGQHPTSPQPIVDTALSDARPRTASRGRLHARLAHLWNAAPTHPGRLSRSDVPTLLLRTIACTLLVFAMLAPISNPPTTDLYPTYLAAQFANEGRWDRVYHRAVWLHGAVDPEWDQRALAQSIPLSGTSFVYHPWYLQLARPIVKRVSYWEFARGFAAVSKACIGMIGLALTLLTGWTTFSRQALLTLTFGIASTTIYGLELGQNVALAMMFSLYAVLAWRSPLHWSVGTVLAGLAWICKPWCASLVVLCFLLRGVRAGVFSSLVLVFAMLGLPLLTLPSTLMLEYKAMNLALSRVSVFGWNNISILSIFERFTYSDWSRHSYEWIPREAAVSHRIGAWLVVALIALSAALLWWVRRPQIGWSIACFFALMILPLGICWTHYLIFASPLALIATFSSKSPLVLRMGGLSTLALLTGVQTVCGISAAQFARYQIHPAKYPWLLSLPMVFIAVTILLTLWLGPRTGNDSADEC